MKTEMEKTFEDIFNPGLKTIEKILESISEDRRPWVSGRIANRLMYGAGSSFMWFNRNPKAFEASLNEALAQRSAADMFYNRIVDVERREAAKSKDIEGVIRSLSGEGNGITERNSKGDEDKEANEAMKLLEGILDEVNEREAIESEYREEVMPYVRGFLEGAKYDAFDIQGSEMAKDRATFILAKLAETMQERCHNDVIHNGGKLKEAIEKKRFSNTFQNKKNMEYWATEVFIAKDDEKTVTDAIKAEGLEVPEQS